MIIKVGGLEPLGPIGVYAYALVAVVDLIGIAFDVPFSMLGHQEEHPACKIE